MYNCNRLWVRKLEDYCRRKGFSLDWTISSAVELDNCLRKFIFGLQMKKSDVPRNRLYKCLVHNSVPFSVAGLVVQHIVYTDSRFQHSNLPLTTLLKKNKVDSNTRPVNHKEALLVENKWCLHWYCNGFCHVTAQISHTVYWWCSFVSHLIVMKETF